MKHIGIISACIVNENVIYVQSIVLSGLIPRYLIIMGRRSYHTLLVTVTGYNEFLEQLLVMGVCCSRPSMEPNK